MSRTFVIVAVAVIATFATTAFFHTSANAGETIRIETRPIYGAVVTREAGVRVFRPLPPTSKMIINPNRTPLQINVEDSRHGPGAHYHSHKRYGQVIRVAPERE